MEKETCTLCSRDGAFKITAKCPGCTADCDIIVCKTHMPTMAKIRCGWCGTVYHAKSSIGVFVSRLFEYLTENMVSCVEPPRA
jgi:uncharacterized Zn finger protein